MFRFTGFSHAPSRLLHHSTASGIFRLLGGIFRRCGIFGGWIYALGPVNLNHVLMRTGGSSCSPDTRLLVRRFHIRIYGRLSSYRLRSHSLVVRHFYDAFPRLGYLMLCLIAGFPFGAFFKRGVVSFVHVHIDIVPFRMRSEFVTPIYFYCIHICFSSTCP